jgi:hypothetical protein
MPRKPKGTQNQPDGNPGKSTETATSKRAGTPKEVTAKNTREISRPRVVLKSERAIQQGIERAQQRKSRELSKTRGLGAAVRPHVSSTGLIQREEKRFPTGRTVSVEAETRGASIFEEQASVKWVAWGALIISIVSLILSFIK